MIPWLVCFAVGIPVAFAIGGGIPWLGIFDLAPIIAVALGVGLLIYYLIGDIDRDRQPSSSSVPFRMDAM